MPRPTSFAEQFTVTVAVVHLLYSLPSQQTISYALPAMKHSYKAIVRPVASQFSVLPRSSAASFGARRLHQCSSFARPQIASQILRKPFSAPLSRIPARRYESNLAVSGQESPPPEDLQPAYQLTFTCKPCKTRSAHRVTKQGYHHGTTLITCPNCKVRHLISDHLKIFSDTSITLEDIMKRKLQDGRPLADLLKKGKLGIRQGAIVGVEGEEDLEFWEDGTETTHEKAP